MPERVTNGNNDTPCPTLGYRIEQNDFATKQLTANVKGAETELNGNT